MGVGATRPRQCRSPLNISHATRAARASGGADLGDHADANCEDLGVSAATSSGCCSRLIRS